MSIQVTHQLRESRTEYVNVTAFGKTRLCKAELRGPTLDNYEGRTLLYVERGEELYGSNQIDRLNESWATVNRSDFLRGEDV